MRRIEGETFEVCHDESRATIVFRGALRLCGTTDYEPLLQTMRTALDSGYTPLVLDLRDLNFLNSSGITMFSRFVIEARERRDVDLQVLASLSVPWHSRSLRNFEKLMPRIAISFEV